MILLISPKTAYATQRIVEEAKNASVGIETFDVQELAEKNFNVDVSRYQALYVRQANPYFNEIITLAKKFKEAGKFVVDGEMIVGGFETSKAFMYQKLEASNISIPKTLTLVNSQDQQFFSSTLNPAERDPALAGPETYVLKWIYGFGGHDTHLVHNQEEFTNIIAKHPQDEWLVQEYIEADFEYQVITVGYASLPLVLRFKVQGPASAGSRERRDSRFKADLHRYSIFKAGQLPEVVRIAEEASKATGRELAKVDILQKGDGLYVLEVNRSPSLLPFEPYSKLNVAGEFVRYISSEPRYRGVPPQAG